MIRSSIFSFDTLEVRPRLTAPVWGALAILVVARLGLLTQPDAFLTVTELGSQDQYVGIEAHHRLAANPSPNVIIAGTSRLSGLPMDCLATELGVPEKAIANYSRAGNTFWRVLALLRRNPDALQNLDLLVMDVLPFQYYQGPLFAETNPLFLALATVEERTRVEKAGDQLLVWSDTVYPWVSERRRIIGWWDRFSRLAGTPEAAYEAYLTTPRPNAVVHGARVGRSAERTKAYMMRCYAPGDRPSPIQAAALKDLQALLPEDTRLVLTWLPVREDFRQHLQAPEHGFVMLQADLQSRVPQAEMIWATQAAQWELGESDFTDVVHFSETGFQKVCHGLGNALSPLLPAPQTPVRP